jgi:hypothetical protein
MAEAAAIATMTATTTNRISERLKSATSLS